MVPRWPRRVLIRAHWRPKGIPRASCWWFWIPKVSSRGPFWHPKGTFWPSRWYPWASKARFRQIFDFMLLFGSFFVIFYRYFRPWHASNNSRAWHDMLEVCVLFEKSRPSENTCNYHIFLTLLISDASTFHENIARKRYGFHYRFGLRSSFWESFLQAQFVQTNALNVTEHGPKST